MKTTVVRGVKAAGVLPAMMVYGFITMAATGVATTAGAQVLEEIVVTAQRREVNLQSAAVAVTAYSGKTLEDNRVFSMYDLANNVPAFSLTANTPLDLEMNIRGVTNTRLDSPTADPSVGLFFDEVYIGRTGDMNTDFFDIERIEVIRGPQGVLLGKNVVGGALSVIPAKPEFDRSGEILVSYGNYDSLLLSGHVTGALTESLAGRFSFHSRSHDGYGYDLLSDRELENLDSRQFRGQLLYNSPDGDLNARLMLDYNKESSNGITVIAIAQPDTLGLQPWSTLRDFLGLTDIRETTPERTRYAGEDFDNTQYLRREGFGVTLNIDKHFESFVLTSITGFRDVSSKLLYDQTGGGPDVFDSSFDFADFQTFAAGQGLGLGAAFLFSEPVNEHADISQISQEIRLTSNTDSAWDWIAGVYFKHDEIDKFDRFLGENITGNPALATLSGETHWDNRGEMDSFAVFAQAGYSFNEAWKLSVGLRYTSDDKSGHIRGIPVALGDRFTPGDTVPLTPLTYNDPCRPGQTPPACNQSLGIDTDYGDTWSKLTPQAILEFQPTDDLFFYASIATGFKGGGYEDTPANNTGAQIAFDPEEVINYEVGIKSDFYGGRMRLNAAAFYMDYTDLQVQQTNEDCLCNITDNASDAEIIGLETEFLYAITDSFLLQASGSFLDTEYKDFVENSGVVSTGNVLQRTPENQYSVALDYSFGAGKWEDAWTARLNYYWQDELFWQPSNANTEPAYGLLDGRVSLAPADVQWSVSAWVKNVTDEEYRTNIIPFFGEEVSQFGAPRTYGVDFRWSF